jgi:hypothetical protein
MDAHETGQRDGEIAWPAPLDKRAAAALKQFGGVPLSTREIFASAAMLARPSATPEELVRQAVRLGLLGIGIAEQGRTPGQPSGSRGCRAGYGLLAGEAITIALAGRVPAGQIQALLKAAAGGKKPEVRLVSLGEWLPAGDGFLPIVCTSGEAETVLSSGRINLLLAGPQCDPGIPALCAGMKVSVLMSSDNPVAVAVLKQARAAFDSRVPSTFSPDAGLIGEGSVSIGASEIQAALKDGASAKIALVGGMDTLLQSLGHLPVELAKALRGEDHVVASWGDAALWMLKQELPVTILEAQEGPLAAVRALAAAGKLSEIKGICFTGLKDCREFTRALGLAALGLKVSLAVPIPLWGSEKVRTALRESLAAVGGILAHFDHPVQGEELLEWFLRA